MGDSAMCNVAVLESTSRNGLVSVCVHSSML